MNIKERLRIALGTFAQAVLDTTRSNGDKEKMDSATLRQGNAVAAILEFPMLGFQSMDIQPDEDGEVLLLIQHRGTKRYAIRTSYFRAFDSAYQHIDDELLPEEFVMIGWMQMPDQGFLQDMAEGAQS